VFGKEPRSHEEALADELDINKAINIDNYTMPINDFNEPYSTCCFINDNLIFCNVFYNKTLVHYHFLYQIREKNVINVVSRTLDTINKNFPWKAFYNQEEMKVFLFYRQGEHFCVPIDQAWSDKPIFNMMLKGTIFEKQINEKRQDPNDYQFDKITD